MVKRKGFIKQRDMKMPKKEKPPKFWTTTRWRHDYDTHPVTREEIGGELTHITGNTVQLEMDYRIDFTDGGDYIIPRNPKCGEIEQIIPYLKLMESMERILMHILKYGLEEIKPKEVE